MAGGRNESPTPGNELTWLVGSLLVAGMIFAFWFFAREWLVYPIFAMKWTQVKAYDLIVGLGEGGKIYAAFIESFFDGNRDAKRINWSEFVETNEAIGNAVKYPWVVLIGLTAVVVGLKMKGDGYKNKYSLVQFKRFQAHHWRTAAVSAAFDPDNASKNMMPQLRPIQWLEKNGIKSTLTPARMLTDEAREKALRAFSKDLGEPWRPIPKLPLHVRCLIAVCATRYARIDEAQDLREMVSVIYATNADKTKRDAALGDLIAPTMANESLLKPMQDLAERHGYISTVMIRMLTATREEAGVLAAAEVLWLKDIDRPLWYAINNTGRRAFHIEGAAAFSHFFYEIVTQRPLIEPHVDSALLGLEQYIDKHGLGYAE